jgi:hypothetical protein
MKECRMEGWMDGWMDDSIRLSLFILFFTIFSILDKSIVIQQQQSTTRSFSCWKFYHYRRTYVRTVSGEIYIIVPVPQRPQTNTQLQLLVSYTPIQHLRI